jgi:hypothetical protein
MVKLVRGKGVNDADYPVLQSEIINGKQVKIWMCPFYSKWAGMLDRCYSEGRKSKRPNYEGCTVSEEWLKFSNFKRWMESRDWKGKHLDKDLLFSGNRVYSPEFCLLVSVTVNTFLTDRAAKRGDFKIGVSYDSSRGNFRAQCRGPFTGKGENLGRFRTEDQAHLAWKVRKNELANTLADMQTDDVVANALRCKYRI